MTETNPRSEVDSDDDDVCHTDGPVGGRADDAAAIVDFVATAATLRSDLRRSSKVSKALRSRLLQFLDDIARRSKLGETPPAPLAAGATEPTITTTLTETIRSQASTIENLSLAIRQQQDLGRLREANQRVAPVGAAAAATSSRLQDARRQVTYAAVVEGGSPGVSSAEIFTTIKKNIKPADLGVPIDGIHQGIGKVVIKCANSSRVPAADA